MSRKYLTPKERREMAARQDHKCGCGCGDPLSTEPRGTVAEHYVPVALGNDSKPDHLRNRACALRKTYGGQAGDQWTPVGGDIRAIAHTRRLAERRTQADKRKVSGGSRMKSRPFPKKKRKMRARPMR